MTSISRLHDAVKGGDLSALATLLAADQKLANARSAAPTFRCSTPRTTPTRFAGRRSSAAPG
jgi:hypothetical protein